MLVDWRLALLTLAILNTVSVEGAAWSTPQGGPTRGGNTNTALPHTTFGETWSTSTTQFVFGSMVVGSSLGPITNDSMRLVGVSDVALAVYDVTTGVQEYQYTVYRWKGSHQLQGLGMWPTLVGEGDTLVASCSNSGTDIGYLRVNVVAFELHTGQPIWFFTPPAPVAGTSINGISCVAVVEKDAPVWCVGGLFVQERSRSNTTLFQLNPNTGDLISSTYLFQRTLGIAYLDDTEGITPVLAADGKTIYVPYGEYQLTTPFSTRVAAYDLSSPDHPSLIWSVSSGYMDSYIPSAPAALLSESILAVPLASSTAPSNGPTPGVVVFLDTSNGGKYGAVTTPDTVAWVAGDASAIFVGGDFASLFFIDPQSGFASTKLTPPTILSSSNGVVGPHGNLLFFVTHSVGCSIMTYFVKDGSSTFETWATYDIPCGTQQTDLAVANDLLFVGAEESLSVQCLTSSCPSPSSTGLSTGFPTTAAAPGSSHDDGPFHDAEVRIAIFASAFVVVSIIAVVLCLRSRRQSRKRRAARASGLLIQDNDGYRVAAPGYGYGAAAPGTHGYGAAAPGAHGYGAAAPGAHGYGPASGAPAGFGATGATAPTAYTAPPPVVPGEAPPSYKAVS